MTKRNQGKSVEHNKGDNTAPSPTAEPGAENAPGGISPVAPEGDVTPRELEEREEARAREAGRVEYEMRISNPPRHETIGELADYIDGLSKGPHTYGTVVYAMSLAAFAAYQFIAHIQGVTGFQASCADLDFIRRSRMLDGPFMLVKGEDALYPQHDVIGRVREALAEWAPWLSTKASEKLPEMTDGNAAHPAVVAHWRALAGAGSQQAPEAERAITGLHTKDGIEFFAMDLTNPDQHALKALEAYGRSVRATNPELAADLLRRAGVNIGRL